MLKVNEYKLYNIRREIILNVKLYSIYLQVYGPTENNFARNPSIFTLLVLRVLVEWFEPDVRANTSEFNVPVNLCILACYSILRVTC